MPDLSVIIPARAEGYLAHTVSKIHAAIRGDTEILVVIDGAESGPSVPDLPGVRVIRHAEPMGQRQSVNEAARLSQAKYLLKTDGHSMLSDGFDVVLMRDYEPDWTVIPTMYNLHAHDLICRKCGSVYYNRGARRPCPKCGVTEYDVKIVFEPNWRRRTDWMFFRSPDAKERPMRVQYWGQGTSICRQCGEVKDPDSGDANCGKCGVRDFRKGGREYPEEYASFKAWSKQQPPIADVMTGQGACWFLSRERFWKLGGLDEGHGSWGQMGVEIACKACASGGRHVVNRDAWFAHFFRCGDGESFPYQIHGSDQERARRYSIDLWTSGRWPLQKRPLEWIAEKFAPVPTWPKAAKRRDPVDRVDRSDAAVNNVTKVNEVLTEADIDQVDAKTRHVVEQLAMSNAPTLSVLIPARNEEFLEATVRDLLKNLRLDFEILVGLDGSDQVVPQIDDPRVRFLPGEKVGMRPTLNRLLAAAKGRFILKLDAHCAIAEGMDDELVKAWEPGDAVVGSRYDLDTATWQRRDFSKTDCRRLTHISEDGIGLRSMAWPEWAEAHKDEEVSETMTCSGSCFLIERALWTYWGGWDEQHGHFGQEGAELACKVWLSGGRLLENKRTWYAHWNRGKAPYAMGATVKPQSIAHSHDLWLGDKWPFQKYSFAWLLARFHPPGWESEMANHQSQIEDGVKSPHHHNACKAVRVSVDALWSHRRSISEPAKVHRLDIFWSAFGEFVDSVLAGKPDYDCRYKQYLISHLRRGSVRIPTRQELRIVKGKMKKAAALVLDIRDHGLRSPLEFYEHEGRLILWKGYRRLVILQRLGVIQGKRAIGRLLGDARSAMILSPQYHLHRMTPPEAGPIQKLMEEQYVIHRGNATDKHWVHNYHVHYDRHIGPIRKRARKVLECGLAHGSSLAIWRDYFPERTRVVGFDCDPERWKKFAGDLPNTAVYIGDERNEKDVQSLIAAGPYDLIVDDASHAPEDQRRLFDWLWPSVRPFGWYVIEDIHRSFDPGRRGDLIDHIDPTVNEVNRVNEGPSARCVPVALEDRLYGVRDIREIHWYHNIVFIQRAP
jgi:glycosyltransferase involved in cell wall biosynthesis/ribosomal protein L40E